MDGLDDSQRLAATSIHGAVRIIAGAGAGKTRTITRRIAYACARGQWEPQRTLAVTFSVKAAAEMRQRLAGLGVDGVQACTFHSAALRQLRHVWPELCDAPFPHITNQADAIMGNALRRVFGRVDTDQAGVRLLRAEVDWAKVSLVAAQDYPRVCAALHRTPPAGLQPEQFADVYDMFDTEKTSRGEMDFNDILLMMCHVLDQNGDEAQRIRAGIGWLTVDEYQDVSPLQHRLMRLWLGDNREVCVVGDPAQTIYSFAGASSYELLHFAEEFAPLSTDIHLDTDYRSTGHVVGAANAVLRKSPYRDDYLVLRSARSQGARVQRTAYATDEQEVREVARQLVSLRQRGVALRDCAVLTRLNAQHGMVRAALREVGLASTVRAGAGLEQSFLESEAEGGMASDTVVEAAQRVQSAMRGDDERGVMISTIHASKGLEFKHVFLIGCCEGLLPYGGGEDERHVEEERRLMYVGITRAEDTLHLSYALTKDGVGREREPSRFLVSR